MLRRAYSLVTFETRHRPRPRSMRTLSTFVLHDRILCTLHDQIHYILWFVYDSAPCAGLLSNVVGHVIAMTRSIWVTGVT